MFFGCAVINHTVLPQILDETNPMTWVRKTTMLKYNNYRKFHRVLWLLICLMPLRLKATKNRITYSSEKNPEKKGRYERNVEPQQFFVKPGYPRVKYYIMKWLSDYVYQMTDGYGRYRKTHQRRRLERFQESLHQAFCRI